MSRHDVPRGSRDGAEAVLARIAADPAFRQRLHDDPSAALQGLAIDVTAEPTAEVFGLGCTKTCKHTCKFTYVTR
jgi:hypothetical protein